LHFSEVKKKERRLSKKAFFNDHLKFINEKTRFFLAGLNSEIFM